MNIQWIETCIALPDADEKVLVIHCGEIKTATFKQGISQNGRERMKNGELPNTEDSYWDSLNGYHTVKRSDIYTSADEFGNNLVPYCWDICVHKIFGQEIKYWAKLPNLEKYSN